MTKDDPLPEQWRVDAGDAALARLDIAADAQRERRFEIACSMTVSARSSALAAPWHELRVYADGELQWSRRIPTQAAEFDGLEYRFSRSVPVGGALRLQARADCGASVRRLRLLIEADEI